MSKFEKLVGVSIALFVIIACVFFAIGQVPMAFIILFVALGIAFLPLGASLISLFRS